MKIMLGIYFLTILIKFKLLKFFRKFISHTIFEKIVPTLIPIHKIIK